jgi:two-component system, OmpR family, response regulator
MRVLYVDDDRVNSLLFVETCRLAGGIEVETAITGAEALDMVSHWVPDLLIIDLHLPDTDGYRLLADLRHGLRAPALPAILCTADEAALVQAPARAAGFDDCWTKPVELQAVIDELTRRNRSPGAAS